MRDTLRVFAMNACASFGQQVTRALGGVSPCSHDERYFPDREAYCASLENVRGCDCYVIQSCYSDHEESVNDKLVKMLVFIGSLRDASAARITAVIPYFPYARQDRKTTSRAPITTKYVARWLQGVKTDRILTIDAHNPTAVQNAFSINVDLLEANGLFAKYMAQEIRSGSFGFTPGKSNEVVVMSPDAGGLGRARKFRGILERYLGVEVGMACMDKIHNDSEIRGNGIIGKVKDRFIILLDDMVSSGKTVLECVDAARKHGAHCMLAVCATHGLFVGKANEYLDDCFLKRVVVTDTVSPFRLTAPAVKAKLVQIGTAELFAEAIRRTHMSESISDLIEKTGWGLCAATL